MAYQIITLFTRIDKTNEEVVFHSMCIMLSVLFTELTLVVSMTAACMECIFIEITGADVGSNGNILVGLLYRPPSQSLVSFYEQLTQLMTKLTREKKKC